MRPFIPEANQIQDRWFAAWGEQFNCSELAVEMARNPRTAERMGLSVLESMQIDTRTRFEEEELVPVAQFIDDKQRLVRICGLVIQGQMIRSQVSKADFDQMSKLFDREDLRIAASLPHLHSKQSNFGFQINRLKELVDHSGAVCVDGWRSTLSDEMALRLRLLEAEDHAAETTPSTADITKNREIVLAVSRKLCGLPVQKAA